MAASDPTSRAGSSPPARLSDIYDDALPEVYRYVRGRCGSVHLAEELTSATFVQAALEQSRGRADVVSVSWLMTVARHKLVDHWRRQEVAERSLTLLEGGVDEHLDPWDEVLDQARAASVLHHLPAHYQAALTLRYLDDLPVADCAEMLDRTVRGTESLLVRARAAFRQAYEASEEQPPPNHDAPEGSWQ